ncbi:DNA-binding response regulator MtrA [Geobacter sp. OR-1]|uniref:response regulator n=1 Tax=Geobacter sp. OR-1 TaxID=1266765 RepID=UPI0005422307|nr:response regulator [Geobacter sp. OR-1]GAM08820.1 DNA-binding response regulator MtrA [Geobacter sp. OR-1]
MGTKLLLADDSITIQKVVGIIFANEDYELTVVDNGVQALEKAREIMPSVMLVDALMPGRNGYEVCQEVRNDPTLNTIPLLLMTGAFEPFDENKARQCGADDFISKPFESQQLVEKVKMLLEIGRQRAVATPSPVAAEPVVPETEQAFAPPLAGPWDEPVQDFESSFEPIPEMFDLNLSPEPAQFEEATVPDEEVPSELAVEIVEAAPGDDPWGVFDLVDLEATAASPVETLELPAEEVEEPPITDPFAGEQVAEEASEPAVFQPEAEDAFEAKWEPLEEEVFTYQHEEPTPPGETFAVGMGGPLADLANIPEQFTDEIVFGTTAQQDEPAPQVITSEVAPEPAVTPAAAPIDEDQLRAMLSQISRETIEKIVWEIVPDLAENLIREEIRKIKQGFGS